MVPPSRATRQGRAGVVEQKNGQTEREEPGCPSSWSVPFDLAALSNTLALTASLTPTPTASPTGQSLLPLADFPIDMLSIPLGLFVFVLARPGPSQ